MVLPYINMNPPQVYTCSPSWNPPSSLPVPSLRVVSVHQPQASSIMYRTWTGDSFHIWYYTCFDLSRKLEIRRVDQNIEKFMIWEGHSKECFVAYPRLLKIKSRYSVKKMIDLQKIEMVKQVTVTQGPWTKWLKFFLLNGKDSLCSSALVKIKFCAFTLLSMFINHHLVSQMYFLFR